MAQTGSRRHDEVGTGQIARMAWTAAPANYDIQASDPGNERRCSRRIIVGTAGTIVYTGADGTDVTIPSAIVSVCPVIDISMRYLKDTSTAQNVLVVW